MHKFIPCFDCNGNTKTNPRNGEKYSYMMQENNIQAQPCCIVTYDEAKIIQNTYHILSVHFTQDDKYGLKGIVFKDTNMLRKVLEKIHSKEV